LSWWLEREGKCLRGWADRREVDWQRNLDWTAPGRVLVAPTQAACRGWRLQRVACSFLHFFCLHFFPRHFLSFLLGFPFGIL
jgi:hypothetical protein